MAFAVLGYLLAEIVLISVVAGYLGIAATLGLLVLSAAVGVWVLRRAGGRSLGSVADTVGLRRPNGRANIEREITDSLLRTGGGFLLVIPGFLSSLLGLALLFPPSRAPLRGWLTRRSASLLGGGVGFPTASGFGFPTGRPPFRGDVVDGDVIDGEVVHTETDPGPSRSRGFSGTVVDMPGQADDTRRSGGGQQRPNPPRQTAPGEHGTAP